MFIVNYRYIGYSLTILVQYCTKCTIPLKTPLPAAHTSRNTDNKDLYYNTDEIISICVPVFWGSSTHFNRAATLLIIVSRNTFGGRREESEGGTWVPYLKCSSGRSCPSPDGRPVSQRPSSPSRARPGPSAGFADARRWTPAPAVPPGHCAGPPTDWLAAAAVPERQTGAERQTAGLMQETQTLRLEETHHFNSLEILPCRCSTVTNGVVEHGMTDGQPFVYYLRHHGDNHATQV